jgi:hypothetical protein
MHRARRTAQRSAPLDNDHGYGNNSVKDHLHLLKGLQGDKGVEQEMMHTSQMHTLKDMLNCVPQIPHIGHHSCDTLSEQVSFNKLVLLSGPAEDCGEGQCRLDQEHPEEPDGDGEGPACTPWSTSTTRSTLHRSQL